MLTVTPAIARTSGTGLNAKAAEAAVIARGTVECFWSNDSTHDNNWVSWNQPGCMAGRIGRSMSLDTKVSWSEALLMMIEDKNSNNGTVSRTTSEWANKQKQYKHEGNVHGTGGGKQAEQMAHRGSDRAAP